MVHAPDAFVFGDRSPTSPSSAVHLKASGHEEARKRQADSKLANRRLVVGPADERSSSLDNVTVKAPSGINAGATNAPSRHNIKMPLFDNCSSLAMARPPARARHSAAPCLARKRMQGTSRTRGTHKHDYAKAEVEKCSSNGPPCAPLEELKVAGGFASYDNRTTSFQSVSTAESDQVSELVRSIQGRVVKLSMEAGGCRTVQHALEVADDAVRVTFANEFRGHIHKVVASPHANHVVQLCIELLRPSSVFFILQEIANFGPPAAVARHPYGCRVLQRLIEHFPPSALAPLVDELLNDAAELCREDYGNYVMQHIIEHGEPLQRQRLMDALRADLPEAALHKHASTVLDKAFIYCFPECMSLAADILARPKILPEMVRTRCSAEAAESLMRILPPGSTLRQRALSQLAARPIPKRAPRCTTMSA